MAELTECAARELNLRIISPDRPGIRNSTFHPERKLLDWPPLLAEIADKMGIGEFRILGISGGAPYALAAAWAMPERVRAIAVVSGAPPITELADPADCFRSIAGCSFFIHVTASYSASHFKSCARFYP